MFILLLILLLFVVVVVVVVVVVTAIFWPLYFHLKLLEAAIEFAWWDRWVVCKGIRMSRATTVDVEVVFGLSCDNQNN